MTTPVARGPQTRDGRRRTAGAQLGSVARGCSCALLPLLPPEWAVPVMRRRARKPRELLQGDATNGWRAARTSIFMGLGGSALGPDSNVAPGLTVWEIRENSQLHLQLRSLSPHGSTVLMKLMLFKERTFGFTGCGTPRNLSD